MNTKALAKGAVKVSLVLLLLVVAGAFVLKVLPIVAEGESGDSTNTAVPEAEEINVSSEESTTTTTTLAGETTTTTLPTTLFTGLLALLSSQTAPLLLIVAILIILVIFFFTRKGKKR